MFVVVNVDNDEEGSTDDEGEDGLDLSNMFDEIAQDTNDIIETNDALQQDLFSPMTPSLVVSPSAVATPQQPQEPTKTQSDIPTKKPSETAPKEPIGTSTGRAFSSPQGSSKHKVRTPHRHINVNQGSSEDSDVPVAKYQVMKSQAKIILFLVYVLSQVVYVNFT